MARRGGGTTLTAGLVAAALLASCSGDGGSTTTTSAVTTPVESTTDESSAEPSQPTSSTEATVAPATAPSTSSLPDIDDERPGVVAREGSIEDVLGGVTNTEHFAGLVTWWLTEVPGQEGVLRNARGITLFVPSDDAFTEADRNALEGDVDATARFIGEHLVVDVIPAADLAGTVVTAMGTEHEVTDSSIGGRAIVESDIDATNGVIHVIDGVLVEPG